MRCVCNMPVIRRQWQQRIGKAIGCRGRVKRWGNAEEDTRRLMQTAYGNAAERVSIAVKSFSLFFLFAYDILYLEERVGSLIFYLILLKFIIVILYTFVRPPVPSAAAYTRSHFIEHINILFFIPLIYIHVCHCHCSFTKNYLYLSVPCMQNLWKKVGRCIYYQRRWMSLCGLVGRQQLLNR